MAEEEPRSKGLESLLQTLDPERQKILLFLLQQDHRARLGAELVGPRAFYPEDTGGGTRGWTTSDWGDITLAKNIPPLNWRDAELKTVQRDAVDLVSKTLYENKKRSAIKNWAAKINKDEKAELEKYHKRYNQLSAKFLNLVKGGSDNYDELEGVLQEQEKHERTYDKIAEKYHKKRLAGFPGLPAKDFRTAAEKLLYKDGILQPFVFSRQAPPMWRRFTIPGTPLFIARDLAEKFERYPKKTRLQEMLTLSHELGHVADVWLTDHRVDPDAEFSGKAGSGKWKYGHLDPKGDEYWKNEFILANDPRYIDHHRYGHKRIVSGREVFENTLRASDPEQEVIIDEPYSRLMDRYNRERLFRAGYQPPGSGDTERLAYVPDRSFPGLEHKQSDPFATKNYETVTSRDAAAHPVQGSALMELNRILGRSPLKGMDAWLKRHGHAGFQQ